MFQFKRWLVTASVVMVALLSIQTTRAVDCAGGNIDACWARFYAPGDGSGEESRVYFRIFKACQDGMQIGVAANIVDNYDIYIKQYGGGQSPPFRLLTETTTIPLTSMPAGVSIEWTAETADSFAGLTTVYYMKIINIGWSESFDSNYAQEVMIASPSYGFSQDGPEGIVRAQEFQNCKLFTRPFFRPSLAPFVQCVIDGRGNTLTAVFGYYNYTGYDTIIPKGPYNRISQFGIKLPVAANQPTYLEKGLHYNVVTVTKDTFSLTWKLGTVSRTATAFSLPCRR
jgi:hypothetical protein